MTEENKKYPLELLSALNESEEKLKEAKHLISVLEKNIDNLKIDLCKVLPNKKWVYFSGYLYGVSSTNWGGGTSHLEKLDVHIPRLNDGDNLEDWTGKLGYKQVNYD